MLLRGRRLLVVGAGLAALALVACSLFTDLDGLHDPATDDSDDGGRVDGGGGGDGNSNAPSSNEDGGNGTEGGSVHPLANRALILFGGERSDGGANGLTGAPSVAVTLLSEDGGIGPWTETPLDNAGWAFNQLASVGSSAYAPRDPLSMVGTIAANKIVSWSVGASPKQIDACVASSGDTIFMLGGRDEFGNFTKQVRMALVPSSTTPLAWTTTTGIPQERNFLGCAGNGNFVYIGGGKNPGGMHQAGVFYATRVAASGGLADWKSTTPLPFTTYWPRFVIAGNRLVVVGGEHDDVDHNSVYHALIQADGSLAAWQIGTTLPAARWGQGVSAVGDRIYVTGGGSDNGAVVEVYTATIDPTTGLMSTWVPLAPLPVGRQNHGSAIVKIP